VLPPQQLLPTVSREPWLALERSERTLLHLTSLALSHPHFLLTWLASRTLSLTSDYTFRAREVLLQGLSRCPRVRVSSGFGVEGV